MGRDLGFQISAQHTLSHFQIACHWQAGAVPGGIVHSQNGAMSRVSFGVYKPRAGCHTDDVVAQMLRTAASIEKRSTNINITVLRCIRGDWVAAVAESKATEDANPWLNLPEAATFTKGLSSVIQTVDAGWFELACEERKEGFSFGKKRVGDVVSVRKIYSEGKNKDKGIEFLQILYIVGWKEYNRAGELGK